MLIEKMLKKIKYEKIKSDFGEINKITKKLVKQDPRRIVHSIKVGVAITVVSLFYYFDLLYRGFGINAMWAVLTTVVVFEFSVGATLGKGVNRIIATIIGGMSAVGAHRLSSLPQKKLQPFLLGLSVFITASVATFIRFYPKMKARFDYGLLIFILTFSLICVSGYRDDEVIEMAHERISSLLIGSAAAVIVCVLICPVWAGTDLHNLVATNILNLSIFFQGFGLEYFKTTKDTSSNDDNNQDSLDGFKSVVDSKNNIDTLLNFVKWEPRHGGFKKSHPWTEYQKISELCRHCGYRAQVLHGYLYSQHQAPKEVKDKFREVCVTMSTESGKALKEVSIAMTKMRKASKAKPHLESAKEATQDLNLLLDSNIWKSVKLSDVTGAATVASLLAEVVGCMEEIGEAVQELASLAKFKDNDVDDNDDDDDDTEDDDDNDDDKVKFTKQGSIKRRPHANHVILIDDSSSAPTKSHPVPTKSHPAPTKSHPVPTKTHPAATKPHPAPTKPHAAPNKPHAVPNKPHAAPTKSHPAPTKPHATSTKSHPASLAVMHQQTDAE